MNVYIYPRKGKKRYDVTDACISVKWSGDVGSCCRTLDLSLAHKSGVTAAYPCEAMDVAELYEGERLLFVGRIWKRTKASGSNKIDVTAFDDGFYLKKIDAQYKFKKKTPKQIVKKLCDDYKIEMGTIANPNYRLTRNFLGVSLYKIIQTAYTMASNKTNTQYQIVFSGGKLTVTPRGNRDATYAIAAGVNLAEASTTESAENVISRVKIYGEDDKFKKNVDNKARIREYGILQKVVKQSSKDTKVAEAKQILRDGTISQKITVTALGNTNVSTGDAIYIKEPSTGITGRFFVDSDTHTWENGKYMCKLTLNFRNIMDQVTAGGEETGYAKSKTNGSANPNVNLTPLDGWDEDDPPTRAAKWCEEHTTAEAGWRYDQGSRYGAKSADCSSFVNRAYAMVGIALTGGTAAGESLCKNFDYVAGSAKSVAARKKIIPGGKIPWKKLKPGDLIFYSSKAYDKGRKRHGYIYHVSMVSTNTGKIVHARNPRDGILVEDAGYSTQDIICIKRWNGKGKSSGRIDASEAARK